MNLLTEKYHFILPVLEVLYFVGIVLLSARIIKDTRNVSKTLAYLLLIIFLPVAGVIFYFLFGVNYRKTKFYEYKIKRNEALFQKINSSISTYHQESISDDSIAIQNSFNTINFLFGSLRSPLTTGNEVELLINGEEKFPKVKSIIQAAQKHIHLEYYIYEDDEIGNEIADLLILKAKEGVEVRLLYDDFGSRKIGKALLKKLNEAGVMTAPVNKIKFKLLANRANYRDHRKIIIVDGEHVFSGGLNISDKYINSTDSKAIFWRDTHLYLKGDAAFYYQYLFLTNWVFATYHVVENFIDYFKTESTYFGNKAVQVTASGPDIKPAIMLSTLSSIYEAKKRIYITTPYFIPVESIYNGIISQALAGLDVRLLVPKEGDSKLVNAAAYSYYADLLKNGVRIFFYEKGFIHAKTMIIDDYFSSVGTANMDVRSQELNFEVNTHVYDKAINQKLCEVFFEDLKDAAEISLDAWQNRPKTKVFFEHLARLFSPLL